MIRPLAALAPLLALGACMSSDPDDATQASFTPPEASGLVGVRPYPNPDDVCQLIGENDLTAEYLDDAADLVGCPITEEGAIVDRIAEGGVQVAVVGDYVLLSVPNR